MLSYANCLQSIDLPFADMRVVSTSSSNSQEEREKKLSQYFGADCLNYKAGQLR